MSNNVDSNVIMEIFHTGKKFIIDESHEVLIIYDDHKYRIISKQSMEWNYLSYDSSYMRAIILGQGRWDEIDYIEKSEAEEALKCWIENK